MKEVFFSGFPQKIDIQFKKQNKVALEKKRGLAHLFFQR